MVTVLLTCVVVAAAAASPLSPAARGEIDALMSKLEASGCEFNRNGNWHSGTDAKSHLLRKLKYLEEKGMVQSTEQFIELAASSSSVSGKPYLVKCGNLGIVESKVWLLLTLKELRQSNNRVASDRLLVTANPRPRRGRSGAGFVLQGSGAGGPKSAARESAPQDTPCCSGVGEVVGRSAVARSG